MELLRFYAERYINIIKDLVDVETMMRREETRGELSDQLKKAIQINIEVARHGFEDIGLQVCVKHADELLLALSIGMLRAHNIEALHENMRREISCQFLVGIAPERKAAFCESLKGWEDVIKAFPSATDDVEEMNKCFALCRYSAAVFHSLLVVEHGLITFGKKIGATDHKEGWDATCKKLQSIVDAGHSQNTTGIDFSFLEQVNACIQAMKFAWRNKVNHAAGKITVMGGGFAPYVAQDIISATHNFMARLQEGGIKEPDRLETL